MAGLSSIATTAIQALNVANTLVSATQRYNNNSGERDYAQKKAETELTNRQLQDEANLRKEQIAQEARLAEEKRRAALKGAIAKQRAEYGGSGVSAADGSGEAVLLGLFDASEMEREEKQNDFAYRSALIDQNAAGRQRINTLQLAQLKERDKLKKAGSILDTVTSFL